MSEMMWVVIYIYALLIGTLNDEISIMSMSFFILALAGMEFCSGILLAILFKRIIKIELFNDQNVNQKKVLSFFRGKAAK